jgi:alpha-tubulin suppressor-like RCC1 family protein
LPPRAAIARLELHMRPDLVHFVHAGVGKPIFRRVRIGEEALLPKTTSIKTAWAMLAACSAIPAFAANYSAMSWGFNNDGELGNGTVQMFSPNGTDVPGPVSGLSGVVAIAAGAEHSLALKSDGTVWAWGYNVAGQLGNGTFISSDVPVQVSGLSSVVAIAAGTDHSLALKSDGTVWAWGDNEDGELGNYPFALENSDVPVQVSGLSSVAAIAAGSAFSMALKSDGTVWTWGINSYGNLGNGTFGGTTYMPGQVTGLTGVMAIASGDLHQLALKKDGTVWAWGENEYGEVGNGTFTNPSAPGIGTPVQVSGLAGVTAISGGDSYSLALKSDGTVWAWGLNDDGQLGNGTATFSGTTPGCCSDIPGRVSGLTGVTGIAAGFDHGMAVKSDGTVWAWGAGDFGELGNGTFQGSPTPVQVSGLSGAAAIAGGTHFSLALAPPTAPAAFFIGEASLGSGVYYLQFPDGNLFGYFNFVASSIFYHYDMGYEAFVPGSASDIYLYDFTSSHWFYTSTTLFPYLYDFTLNSWIYYFSSTTNPGHYSTNPRYFSNLTTGKIFTM